MLTGDKAQQGAALKGSARPGLPPRGQGRQGARALCPRTVSDNDVVVHSIRCCTCCPSSAGGGPAAVVVAAAAAAAVKLGGKGEGRSGHAWCFYLRS